jgi:hypothetical protein
MHGLVTFFLEVIVLAIILRVIGLGALQVLFVASRMIVALIVSIMIVGSVIITVTLVAPMVVTIFMTTMLPVA